MVLPSAQYGAEVIDMKGEEIDKLQKAAENTAMRIIFKASKWAAKAAIGREIGLSNMKARMARNRPLYLRRIETGNNEALKIYWKTDRFTRKVNGTKSLKKIHELSSNRRTGNKRKDSERNQRKNSNGNWERVERRTGEVFRDIEKIQKWNEWGGLQRKSKVNGEVVSENK